MVRQLRSSGEGRRVGGPIGQPLPVLLLAQLPVQRLQQHVAADPAHRADLVPARRRRELDRVPARRRLLAVFFVALGGFTVLGLGWSTLQSIETRTLDGGEVVRLSIMAIATLGVVGQAVGVLRTLPGGRGVWLRWLRLRRIGRRPVRTPRLLLAQVSVADMARRRQHEPTSGIDRVGSPRLARWGGSGAWVAATLVLIALAVFTAATLLIEAVGSLLRRELGVGLVITLPLAAVVAFGVTRLSRRLVESWFARGDRDGRRLLVRISRYLLRWLRNGPSVATGGLARAAVVTTCGVAVVAALSLAPVIAGSGPSDMAAPPHRGVEVSTAVSAQGGGDGGSGSTQPGGAEPPSPTAPTVRAREKQVSGRTGTSTTSTTGTSSIPPSDTTTVPPGATSTTATTSSTTSSPTTTTATTTTATTTTATTTTATTTTPTTTTPSTTSSTTTTTTAPDTTGPDVKGVSATPGTIFTSGNPPDTASISATVTDKSGLASVVVYYRSGKNPFTLWGPMKPDGADGFVVGFGPFGTVGSYEYRIVATDTVGNTNCSPKSPGTCPGGFVEVILS